MNKNWVPSRFRSSCLSGSCLIISFRRGTDCRAKICRIFFFWQNCFEVRVWIQITFEFHPLNCILSTHFFPARR